MGPKAPSARIRVPKPLHPMMFEHCDSHITKVVSLPVVFQRFGGTQIASWGPPDRLTDSLTEINRGRGRARCGTGGGRLAARHAPRTCAGIPWAGSKKYPVHGRQAPPFTPIYMNLHF